MSKKLACPERQIPPVPFTIGVLSSALTSPFHKNLFLGVADFAEQHNLNCICFAGGPIKSPHLTGYMRNSIYATINTKKIDGLIIPISSLTRYASEKDFFNFLKPFKNLPIIGVGTSYPSNTDIPIVRPDYKYGMKQIVHHMIKKHHRKRLLFYGGPREHLSSQERLEGYLEALHELGIEPDPRLICHGFLLTEKDLEYFSSLVKDPAVGFDCVLTLNDTLAIEFINFLRQKNITVPDTIAVCGFQGIEAGLYCQPPLTTVNEMIYEQGKKAAELLYQKLLGQTPALDNIIATELAIRSTCGCPFSGSSSHIYTEPPFFDIDDFNTFYKNLNQSIETTAVIPSIKLAKPYDKMIEDFNYKIILKVFERLNLDLSGQNKKRLFREMVKILTLFEHNLLKYQDIKFKKIIHLFRQIGYNLISNFNLPYIIDLISDIFKVTYCYIAVYEDKKYPFKYSRLIMAYHDKKLLSIKVDSNFLTSHILPDDMVISPARYTAILEPLYYQDENLGYMITNIGLREGTIYEALHTQISGALKNELQRQELLQAEQRFKDIAHNSTDWLWETDAQGKFTYCSISVKRMIGYSPREMRGKSLYDLLIINKEDQLKYLKKELTQKKQHISNIEIWSKHKDGNKTGLLISATPVIKANGDFTGYRGVFKDITRKKKAQEKIKYLAFYDELTHLPNHMMFSRIFKYSLSMAKRENKKIAIMFFDLDNFKIINDTLGHDIGNKLLRDVALRIKHVMRGTDTVARFGGDEFVVLIPNLANLEEPAVLAAKIQGALAKPFLLMNQSYQITTSIGISVYPQDGKSEQSLIRNADLAMYRAKDSGKNRFIFYDRDIESKSLEKLKIGREMYKGMENNEFKLYYLPKFRCRTHEITGLELLIRWDSADFGMLYPQNFITIAENSGFIDTIEEWIFETIASKIVSWHAQNIIVPSVSINLSAGQFLKFDLQLKIKRLLEKTGLRPEKLELEITEKIIFKNELKILKSLQELKLLGIRITLDDFCSGYSPISFIKSLPINCIKIDCNFIRYVAEHAENRFIIKSLVEMSHNLGITILAEGVENSRQLEIIEALGVNEFQGFYMCQPLEDIDAYLALNREILRPS